jgi:histidinol phosphatase-like enzyme
MRAVFLDRDGTLIVDPPDLRVDSVEELELLPDTLEALTKLSKLDFGIFLVSRKNRAERYKNTENVRMSAYPGRQLPLP